MKEYIYAVMDDGIVTNIILSDNDEAHDALRIMLNASNVILVNEENGPAYINGDYVSNRFRQPQPYKSWIWDNDSWSWNPPIPSPSNFHLWNEDEGSWVLGPPPFPSWTWDETEKNYIPPTPPPEGNYYWDEDSGSWIEFTPES